MIALKVIDFFFCIGYHVLDKRGVGGVLRRNEAEQRAAEVLEAESGCEPTAPLRRPIASVTWLGLGFLVVLTVIA